MPLHPPYSPVQYLPFWQNILVECCIFGVGIPLALGVLYGVWWLGGWGALAIYGVVIFPVSVTIGRVMQVNRVIQDLGPHATRQNVRTALAEEQGVPLHHVFV